MNSGVFLNIQVESTTGGTGITGKSKTKHPRVPRAPRGLLFLNTQLLFYFVFARQGQRIKRIPRADDQVLLAVQYPCRRPIAYGVCQSLAPNRIAFGGIEGDQRARAAGEPEIAWGAQYAAAHAAAAAAAGMRMFPFHRARANVHRKQRRT